MKRTYLCLLAALAVPASGAGCTGTPTGADPDTAYPALSSEGGSIDSENNGGTISSGDTAEGGTTNGEPNTERGGGFIGSGH